MTRTLTSRSRSSDTMSLSLSGRSVGRFVIVHNVSAMNVCFFFGVICSRNRVWDRSWTRRPIQWSISCRLRSVLSIPMHWLSCTSTRSRCRRPWEAIGRRRNFRFRISIFFLVKWSVNYFLRIYWVQIPIRRWLRDYHQRLVLRYCYWTFAIPSITTSESRLSQVYRGTTIEITSLPWWTTTRHKSLAFPLALSKMSSNILWSWSWMSLNLSPLQSSLSFISNVFSVALLLANTFFPFFGRCTMFLFYGFLVCWFQYQFDVSQNIWLGVMKGVFQWVPTHDVPCCYCWLVDMKCHPAIV